MDFCPTGSSTCRRECRLSNSKYVSNVNLVLSFSSIVILVSAGFAPWRVHPRIDSSSDQVLQRNLSHREKKRQYCAHDETKHVYFSFFNPLKVTDGLAIESLG